MTSRKKRFVFAIKKGFKLSAVKDLSLLDFILNLYTPFFIFTMLILSTTVSPELLFVMLLLNFPIFISFLLMISDKLRMINKKISIIYWIYYFSNWISQISFYVAILFSDYQNLFSIFATIFTLSFLLLAMFLIFAISNLIFYIILKRVFPLENKRNYSSPKKISNLKFSKHVPLNMQIPYFGLLCFNIITSLLLYFYIYFFLMAKITKLHIHPSNVEIKYSFIFELVEPWNFISIISVSATVLGITIPFMYKTKKKLMNINW